MKEGKILYFSRVTGNGRVKIFGANRTDKNYLELMFNYRALNGYDVKSGDTVNVEIRDFQGIPYVERVEKV